MKNDDEVEQYEKSYTNLNKIDVFDDILHLFYHGDFLRFVEFN